MKKLASLFFAICTLCLLQKNIAQEVRVADYQAIQLLINPALTGYYDGTVRVAAYQAAIRSDSGDNNFSNVSAQFRFGKNRHWALGVSVFHSGDKNFQVTSNYIGGSIAKEWILDDKGFSLLRVGFQASYNQGRLDESQGKYYRYSDVNIIKVFPSALRPIGYPLVDVSMSYMNYSTGIFYRYQNCDIRFETGVGIYNLFCPWFSPSPWHTDFRKRHRVAVQNSFSYTLDPVNTLHFNYLLWKEGMYLRDFDPVRAGDTEPIMENVFGVAWQRYFNNNSISFQFAERSLKAIIGIIGLDINQRLKVNLAYEMPLYYKYYDVKHLEFDISMQLGKLDKE
jgi:hypothetical protein